GGAIAHQLRVGLERAVALLELDALEIEELAALGRLAERPLALLELREGLLALFLQQRELGVRVFEGLAGLLEGALGRRAGGLEGGDLLGLPAELSAGLVELPGQLGARLFEGPFALREQLLERAL